jgi:nucleoside-diphosphate-sugar epimerase
MNLVIGNTSQLGKEFPSYCLKISSRNIDTSKIRCFDKIFITFAEQRTFNLDISENDLIKVNVDYTKQIIDEIYLHNKQIIIYGTCELWNAYDGPINLNHTVYYKYSPYIKSKAILYNLLLENRSVGKWLNVNIIHPVNFNSVNRRDGFLFAKIFNSIINKQKINVGDLNICRDIIHPKYLVEESLKCDSDMIIGSGYATNIRDFVGELYNAFDLDYNEYVKENIEIDSPHIGNVFWCETEKKYYDLKKDTINDITIARDKIS